VITTAIAGFLRPAARGTIVRRMDYEWMVERIQAFHRTCDALTGMPYPADPWDTVANLSSRDLVTKYYGELPTFLKIAKALDVVLPSTTAVVRDLAVWRSRTKRGHRSMIRSCVD
jgi:hypothetical protein